jgi:hypothetical protein
VRAAGPSTLTHGWFGCADAVSLVDNVDFVHTLAGSLLSTLVRSGTVQIGSVFGGRFISVK